jgi:hypothetical protein
VPRQKHLVLRIGSLALFGPIKRAMVPGTSQAALYPQHKGTFNTPRNSAMREEPERLAAEDERGEAVAAVRGHDD